MSRLVLIEQCPAGFRPDSEDVTIVAVTAQACYELDRLSIPYVLTSDFESEAELSALEPEHWRRQLQWLTTLDQIVAEHVPETASWRVGPATLAGYHLKVLLDNVFVRGFELERMLGGHDSVVLYSTTAAESYSSPLLHCSDPSVLARLLPLFAAARGFAYEEHRLAADAPGSPLVAGRFERVKAPLRPTYRAIRSALTERARSARATEPLTLLFLEEGYDLGYLIPRAHARGHRCLLLVEDRLVEHRAPLRTLERLPTRVETPESWRAAASAVAEPANAIWQWPDSWRDIPTSELLRPQMIHWLTEVMPAVAARASVFREAYERQSVDLVLAANGQSLNTLAATAVTGGSTESVIIDHGDGAFDGELGDLAILLAGDHNFSPTQEFAGYLRARRRLYAHRTAEVHVGSYRWQAHASLARTQTGRPPARLEPGRPVVVYALTAVSGDGRYLNTPWYPDGFYYHLARTIVDVLAEHPDVTAVVKAFPGDGHAWNPIDAYVADLGHEHLVFSRAPLREWFPWTDRIIFDFPSTGLYEAAAAGLPRLALLYEAHRHRPATVAAIAPYAARFRTCEEAGTAVARFLDTETVLPAQVAPEGRDILEQLEELVRLRD